MKPIWLVIGVIAIVLGLAGAVAIGAFAFGQRPQAPFAGAFNQSLNPMGPGMMGQGWNNVGPNGNAFGGPGFMMGGRGVGGSGGQQQNSLIDIAAKDLNLTVNDLITELQKGKSIADVAKEKGISTDKIVDDYVAARTQTVKSAVEAKQLTQAQADAILALTKANAAAALTRTQTPGTFGFGIMGGNWNGVAPFGQGLPGPRGGMMGGGMMGGRGWR